MRSLRVLAFALALVPAVPLTAHTQPLPNVPIAAESTALATKPFLARVALTAAPRVPVLRAATLERHAPAPSRRHDLPNYSLEAVALAALATKRTTRRQSGKKGKLPMLLDSHVDVVRGEHKNPVTGRNEPQIERIAPGLVDDTDLTDDEIDELTARGVIRQAKPDEVERLEQRETDAERATLVREQEAEVSKLRTEHEAALAEAPESKRAALSEKQTKEMTALQAKHAKALNKLAGTE